VSLRAKFTLIFTIAGFFFVIGAGIAHVAFITPAIYGRPQNPAFEGLRTANVIIGGLAFLIAIPLAWGIKGNTAPEQDQVTEKDALIVRIDRRPNPVQIAIRFRNHEIHEFNIDGDLAEPLQAGDLGLATFASHEILSFEVKTKRAQRPNNSTIKDKP
jgi:hypothetical protein